tara:strand:- start:162 stop:680 length:519 start_codon:yes stop_codon:yes gene_type:complete
MSKWRKAASCAVLLSASLVSACQTTQQYTQVSDKSSCLDIARSFNANKRHAKEQCEEGWRIAGQYKQNENPITMVPGEKPFVSPKTALKVNLRYCNSQLHSNYLQSVNAWQDRVCSAYSPESYRHLSAQEASNARKLGVYYISRPPSEEALEHFKFSIDDPILGCQGRACPQ